MRKCAAFVLALLTVFCISLPSQVSAQNVWIGGGVALPTGDFGDDHSTGFTTVAGVGFPVGPEGLSIHVEGFYGQNKFTDDHHGEKTSPLGVMGGATYSLSPGEDAGLYIFGQAGLMVHKYSADDFDGESDKGLGFGGGAGYGLPLGGMQGWVEGRYMHGMFSEDVEGTSYDYSTGFFAILVGLNFPLGGE